MPARNPLLYLARVGCIPSTKALKVLHANFVIVIKTLEVNADWARKLLSICNPQIMPINYSTNELYLLKVFELVKSIHEFPKKYVIQAHQVSQARAYKLNLIDHL